MLESNNADEELRKRYLVLLNLPVQEATAAHKGALARAHELRKFEIENYWKRSSYFWGFQLVAFGALALTADKGNFNPPIVLIVSVLGALAALTGILTARGSKFWQENWETHVDFLEDAVEGQLHKIAFVNQTVSFSVSRVNERFLEVLLCGWGAAFIVAAVTLVDPELLKLDHRRATCVQIGIPLVGFLLGANQLISGQKSSLRGRAYDRKTLEEWRG
jgi:hypothetical protein